MMHARQGKVSFGLLLGAVVVALTALAFVGPSESARAQDEKDKGAKDIKKDDKAAKDDKKDDKGAKDDKKDDTKEKTIELVMTYGSEKEEWLVGGKAEKGKGGVTGEFNAKKLKTKSGNVIVVKADSMGSGECVEEVYSGRIKAHLVSPASGAYVTLGNAKSQREKKTDLLVPVAVKEGEKKLVKLVPRPWSSRCGRRWPRPWAGPRRRLAGRTSRTWSRPPRAEASKTARAGASSASPTRTHSSATPG